MLSGISTEMVKNNEFFKKNDKSETFHLGAKDYTTLRCIGTYH